MEKIKRLGNLAAVGFEPTPSKWLEPKSSALDHSATLPPTCIVSHSEYISVMTQCAAFYKLRPWPSPHAQYEFSLSVCSDICLWFPSNLVSGTAIKQERTTQKEKTGQSLSVNHERLILKWENLSFAFSVDVMLPEATWGQCCAAASSRPARLGGAVTREQGLRRTKPRRFRL